MEQEAQEAKSRREMMEKDYLAPFLVQHEEGTVVTKDMEAHVDMLLETSRFASQWREPNGSWSEQLLGLSQVELDIFFQECAFTQDEKQDLTRAREIRKARSIADCCKQDFRQRMANREKLINEQREIEQSNLAAKQRWYKENSGSLREEEEKEHVAYCSEVIFRIKILDSRLLEHK